MRALHTVQFLDEEITKSLVAYLMKKGYTEADFMKMSSKQGNYRRALQFISIVAQTCPGLRNQLFMT